jgi:hypothetical protein
MSLKSALILFSCLLLDFPNGRFPIDFPTKICLAFLVYGMYRTRCSLLDFAFLSMLDDLHEQRSASFPFCYKLIASSP